MKNYHEIFCEPFQKAQEIDNTFADISNNKGSDTANTYLQQIGATELDSNKFNIMYHINQFTNNDNKEEDKEAYITSLMYLKNYVKKAEVNLHPKLKLPQAIIETTEGKITAIPFSSINPSIKEVIPFIDNEGRLGKCFELAYTISLNLGIPNEIVTGYTYGYTDKSKFLHSWIETTLNKEEVVIDGTLNTIMNKDGYYLMRHAEVLTRISNETLINDIKNYLSKVGKVPLDVYYLFRDEIVKDLQKNQTIFNVHKH